MKLSILQTNLARGLSTVGRCVGVKPTLPVLANVLLTTEKDRLRLSATNLETGVNYWLPAKILEPGAITIPAKVLTDFVTSLPSQTITLETTNLILHLSCGSFEANINGIAASEFPEISKALGKPTLKLPLSTISKAIFQVAFAAAADEGRPVLTGVLVDLRKDELCLVATDGYRLSKRVILGMGKIIEKEKKMKLIIPARTLTEVGRVVLETKKSNEGESDQSQDEKGRLNIAVLPERNQIMFALDEIEISSKLIEGKFPDFSKIIPTEVKTTVEVDTTELTHAVRVASIFARDSANIIKFSLDPKLGMELSANTKEVGDNVSKIEAKISGDKTDIAFNSRYILDLLSNIGSSRLVLEFSGSLAPGVFKPFSGKEEKSSFLHLIMPVRVQG
jgi:DNA polymerase-3 subunit beta